MTASGDEIGLPPPRTNGGMPLMDALKVRCSTRDFSAQSLSLQVLSDLLWAAQGVNRKDSGKRTAPSAKDTREIEIYVAIADGAYRFDPERHRLRRVLEGDIRPLTGTQDFVRHAPANLVYVADLGRMDTSEENRRLYAAADAGFIAQNVSLFCASAGLGTVVRGSVERAVLAEALGLSPRQQVILAQSVGHFR
ncbi:MAG: SagB/ThcOx family dehydrogenase [Betaproteobacteria bacterium]|nr:SagB/ThcOx family dehydrogenase [Betaproteobacteria bacterium]